MTGPRVTRAAQLAAQLRDAGTSATHDAAAVDALAPVVLVGPPLLRWDVVGGPSTSWRLVAIAGAADPLAAWEQLDDLVEQLGAVLNVETAEPTAWAAKPGADTRPAYVLTLTE